MIQVYFDTIARKLATQKERAVDANDDCQYLAPNGNRCAVGHCIVAPAGAVVYGFQGGVNSLVGDHPEVLPGLNANDVALLVRLQSLHDNPTSWGGFGFENTARRQILDQGALHNLNTVRAEKFFVPMLRFSEWVLHGFVLLWNKVIK